MRAFSVQLGDDLAAKKGAIRSDMQLHGSTAACTKRGIAAYSRSLLIAPDSAKCLPVPASAMSWASSREVEGRMLADASDKARDTESLASSSTFDV